MILRRLAVLLLLLAPLPGFSLALTFALGAEAGGAVLESAVSGLAPKAQAVAGGGISGTLTVEDFFGLGTAVLLSNAWRSDVSGGYQLRGYAEIGLSAFLELAWTVAAFGEGGALKAGGQAGMSASIAIYQSTELTFFVPSVDAEPFVSVRFPGMRDVDFRAGLPVHLLLRRDMNWSVSAGLSVGAAYVFGREARQ